MSFYRFNLLLIFSLVFSAYVALPMERAVDELADDVGRMGLQERASEYDSDSEDEDDYAYPGIPALAVPQELRGSAAVALSRGIHFSPANFDRVKRSLMRRSDDAGAAICCSAAYDLAGQPLDSNDTDEVEQRAVEIQEQITQMDQASRDTFQEIYSNNYDGFHRRLGTPSDDGVFEQFESSKNPQVSTSEDFLHPAKYASGHKFFGAGVQSLDPQYDESGKPKHPYLGKLFVILATEEQIAEQDPYFVVHGHANDQVRIQDHFRKNVLSEREVSFAGLIPGDCVVLSIPLRVPSFVGNYKQWYLEKFGISKSSYLRRQTKIKAGNKETVKTLIDDVILPHIAAKLKAHIAEQCAAHDIRLVFKQLDGSFGHALPALANATDYRHRIQRQNQEQ